MDTNYIKFWIVWNFGFLSFSPRTRFCERMYGIFRNIPCVEMKISKLTKYLKKKNVSNFQSCQGIMIVRNLGQFIHLQLDWLHDQLLDFKVLHIQKLLGKNPTKNQTQECRVPTEGVFPETRACCPKHRALFRKAPLQGLHLTWSLTLWSRDVNSQDLLLHVVVSSPCVQGFA